MVSFESARQLLREFKGNRYAFGLNMLPETGPMSAQLGKRAALVCNTRQDRVELLKIIQKALNKAQVTIIGRVDGAHPNAPREDVERMASELADLAPDVTIAIGGGSTIDAAKAATVLRILGGPIDLYFGTARVGQALQKAEKTFPALLAVQTASSSAAHLTKYSNVTDIHSGQKKLIVDEAIVPPRAVFDYTVTTTMGADYTADGAMEGVAHLLEVLIGAVGRPYYTRVEEVAQVGLRLIVQYVARAVQDGNDLEAREALGLGTDLGGYAIMIGGTNGGHLTSFSLVDILSHGRACAIMNPYYVVFFAPAIEKALYIVGEILKEAGYSTTNFNRLKGRDLGLAVAEAMLELLQHIGLPTRLAEVEGFTDAHIARALQAAKDPQLKMKLENMPVPLSAEMVDEYMASILEAAKLGNLNLVLNAP